MRQCTKVGGKRSVTFVVENTPLGLSGNRKHRDTMVGNGRQWVGNFRGREVRPNGRQCAALGWYLLGQETPGREAVGE